VLEALLLDPTAQPQETFNTQVPAMIKVFLTTFASTRARSPHDGSGSGVFRYFDRSESEKSPRALSLLSVLGSLVGSNQSSRGDLSKITCFQQYVAVILMLDRGGTSDRTLQDLNKWNVCASPEQARETIRRAAAVLTLEYVFPEKIIKNEHWGRNY